MLLTLVRNDITHMRVEAIVAPTDNTLSRVDGAVVTSAYRLLCRNVIHTTGSVRKGSSFGEEQTLRHCYNASLQAALAQGIECIAFPLTAVGKFFSPQKKRLGSQLMRSAVFLKIMYAKESVQSSPIEN